MAYLAKILGGNFSNSIYNRIDDNSAALWTTSQLNNIPSFNGQGGDNVSGAGNSNTRASIAVATGSTYITSTFSFGVSTITHVGLKVGRWLTTRANPTVSICLLDSSSNIVINSSFTLSTIGNYVNYPKDVTDSELYTNSFSWQVYKFPATVSVSLTQSYSLRLSSTTTNFAYLCTATNFRAPTPTFSAQFQASASNIQRFFITSATQTATSNDSIFIQGEFISNSNSITAVTVSMDNITTSTYGPIEIGYGGSLVFATASNTNYYLKLNGDLVVNTGGYLEIGSYEYPIPSSSTASIEFSSTKAAGAGLIIRGYGEFIAHGSTMSYVKANLASNASTFSVTTNINTSWKSNDSIVLAPTNYTATEVDIATISSISNNNILLSNRLTYTHSGSNDFIGEIGNLTRNIRIFGNNTYPSYVDLQGGVCDINYVEFSELGTALSLPSTSNGTTASNWNFRIASGINYATADSETRSSAGYKTDAELSIIMGNTYSGLIYTKSRLLQNSVIKNSQGFMSNLVTWTGFAGQSVNIIANGVVGTQISNILINNNIIYNIRHNIVSNAYSTPGGLFFFQQLSSSNNQPLYYAPKSVIPSIVTGTISNNLFIGNKVYIGSINNTYKSDASSFLPSDFSFINNTIAGSYNPIGGSSYFAINAGTGLFFGEFSGNVFHSNGSSFNSVTQSNCDGAWFHLRGYNLFNRTVDNCTFWRNNLGIDISSSSDTIYSNCLFRDNLNSDIYLTNTTTNIKFVSCTFSNTTGSVMLLNLPNRNSVSYDFIKNNSVVFENCIFSTYSQIFTIATASITDSISRYSSLNITAIFNNCSIKSPLIISTFSSFNLGDYASIKLNNVNGTYSAYYNAGYIKQDTQFTLSGSFSTRAIPTNGYTFTLYKVKPLKFEFKVIPAPINRKAIISVYVRKSVIGDGSAYSGDEVNLVVSENSSVGIVKDTILTTTTSASNGAWEKITGITTTSADNGVFEVYLTCNGNTGFVNVDLWNIVYE